MPSGIHAFHLSRGYATTQRAASKLNGALSLDHVCQTQNNIKNASWIQKKNRLNSNLSNGSSTKANSPDSSSSVLESSPFTAPSSEERSVLPISGQRQSLEDMRVLSLSDTAMSRIL